MNNITHVLAYALLLTIIAILSVLNVSLSDKLDQAFETMNMMANATIEVDVSVVVEPEQIKTFTSTETFLKEKYALDKISDAELQQLSIIYDKARDSDYGLTLVSIAWKESRASTWPVNLDDPSCGPFHNRVQNVLYRERMRDTPFNRNFICGKLINNMDFAIKHALFEIAYWEQRHSGNWRKILAGYNGGHVGNPGYAQEIAEIYSAILNSNFLDIVG